ncbi:hypothetical protein [Frankia sp. Cj5]|nr:hypothetical protein [Frankia sp. Cj5]
MPRSRRGRLREPRGCLGEVATGEHPDPGKYLGPDADYWIVR